MTVLGHTAPSLLRGPTSAPPEPRWAGVTVMSRLPISNLALAVALAACAGCHEAGGAVADKPAPTPAAHAIVQPGAPGQASSVVVWVILVAVPPVALMVQIWVVPERWLSNAILVPSGE